MIGSDEPVAVITSGVTLGPRNWALVISIRENAPLQEIDAAGPTEVMVSCVPVVQAGNPVTSTESPTFLVIPGLLPIV